jgi:hypothetical protein
VFLYLKFNNSISKIYKKYLKGVIRIWKVDSNIPSAPLKSVSQYNGNFVSFLSPLCRSLRVVRPIAVAVHHIPLFLSFLVPISYPAQR